MKIIIEIECENSYELLTHIYVIADQIHKSQDFENGEPTKNIRLEDNNCYGTHEVAITPDE